MQGLDQATQLWLGSPCILPTVDSTNQFLINNPGIRLVIANQQTAGRGQRNHSWFSPEGKNIYLSVRWRTRIKPDITETSVLVAQAVQQLFTESGIRQTTIKPPNDVMINGGKAAGILIEAFTQGTWVDLVTGIGINVWMTSDPEHNINQPWTSMVQELDQADKHLLNRNRLISRLLNILYRQVHQHD